MIVTRAEHEKRVLIHFARTCVNKFVLTKVVLFKFQIPNFEQCKLYLGTISCALTHW